MNTQVYDLILNHYHFVSAVIWKQVKIQLKLSFDIFYIYDPKCFARAWHSAAMKTKWPVALMSASMSCESNSRQRIFELFTS